jgi:hypothetical protein
VPDVYLERKRWEFDLIYKVNKSKKAPWECISCIGMGEEQFTTETQQKVVILK